MPPNTRSLSAALLITLAASVAVATLDRPPASAQAAPPGARPTPTPTPTPACADFTGATPGRRVAVVARLRNGEAAQFETPTPTPATPSATPAAPTPTPTPAAKASPLAFVVDLPPNGLTAATDQHKKPVCLTIGDDGLKMFYALRGSKPPLVKRDGVPASPKEDRLRLTLAQHGSATPWIAVTVNGNGHCVLHASSIDESQFASCSVTPLPTPSPSPSPKQDYPCPDATPTPQHQASLCGSLTVGLDLLQTVLTPKLTGTSFDVCVQAVPAGTLESQIEPACQDPPRSAGGTPPAASFVVDVAYRDDSLSRWRLRGQLGSANDNSSGSGAAASGASAARRVQATGGSSGSGGGSGGSNASGLGGTLTLVRPFSYDVRASIQYQNNKLISGADTQTTQYLSNISATQLAADQSGTKLSSTPDDNDSFQHLDSTRLFSVVQRTPVRGGVTPSTATKPSGAFDYTDLIELAPFDPSKINVVTYGSKLVWAPGASVAAAGWYRDYDQGTSATMVHGESALWTTRYGGSALAGVSHVVANTNTPSSNLYLTTGPDGTGSKRQHSANSVFGVLVPLGTDDAYEAFARVGAMNSGNDYLGLLSWSSPHGGRQVTDDGSTLSYNALAGYRAIDPGYDPLATAYDPFNGAQLVFARTGAKYVSPGSKGDTTSSILLSAARGQEGLRPVYSSVGVGVTFPLGNGPYSMNVSGARSTIAGSVVARTNGAAVVTGTNATTMLDNSFVNASIVYSPNDLLTLSFGDASTHDASCSDKSVCTSKLKNGSKGITASVTAGFRPASPQVGNVLILDGSVAPGSLQTADPGGATIATNVLKASALLAYHYCTPTWSGIEPTFSYRNQVQQDVSTFKPGNTYEAAVDIGFSSTDPFWKGMALRVSASRLEPASGQSFTGPTHSFGVKLVSPPRWEQYKKLDTCVAKPKS